MLTNNKVATYDQIADHVWETLTTSPLSQDPQERATRTFEEVCELCQSIGVDKDILAKILETTYSRPVDSDYEGEIGDVMITLMSTGKSLNVSPLFAAQKKAIRFREKIDLILERNKGKLKADGTTGM